MPDYRPIRRQKDLTTEDFQGETLVYDVKSHQAHCLNELAARVWMLCDGTRSVADLARLIGEQQGAAPDEALIWSALAELDGASLLATPLSSADPNVSSRRRALAQIGWAAGVPLVLSIAVPSPAFAQSGPTGS